MERKDDKKNGTTPLVVKGLPSETQSPFSTDRPSPFPLFDGGQIGTTPRGRAHRREEPRRPEWLKIKLDTGKNFVELRKMIQGLKLNTVCQEARCPNLYECWADRTATFMILGDLCTRHCTFCAVQRHKEGRPLDADEPRHVAEAIRTLDLAHAVITSVNRDELEDGGSRHWAETIRQSKALNPDCRIEVLIPDFCGDEEQLRRVFDAEPDVLNHNTECVERLYPRVRPDADYAQSMQLLQRASDEKHRRAAAGLPKMLTKSGIMVGLGETRSEILQTLRDLKAQDVDIVTIGQYLSPSRKHLGVEKYYTPEEFAEIRERGLEMGFRFVESGPLVRSSYHARRHSDGADGGKAEGKNDNG